MAISNGTNAEVASLLGIKEFAVKKAKEQANMFKKRSLKNAVDYLTDVDYKVKSGQINVDEGMWLSLFKIINEK